MKYIIFFTITLTLSTCKLNKISRFSDNKLNLSHEGEWKSNFKNLVLTRILSQLYGTEFIKCCLSKDASSAANADGLNYDTIVLNKASTIAALYASKMPNGKQENNKVILNYVLDYRLSNELDSITGFYYNAFKIDSIIKSR